jgi:prophage regulatory protein
MNRMNNMQQPDLPPMSLESPPATRFLNAKEVTERIGLSRTTIHRLGEAGGFPKSIPLSPSRVVWIESEIEDWQQEKIAEARER